MLVLNHQLCGNVLQQLNTNTTSRSPVPDYNYPRSAANSCSSFSHFQSHPGEDRLGLESREEKSKVEKERKERRDQPHAPRTAPTGH